MNRDLDRDLSKAYSLMELNLMIAQGLEVRDMGQLAATAVSSLLEVPFAAVGFSQREDGADWLMVGQWQKNPLDAALAQELASLLAKDLAQRAFSDIGFLLLGDLPSAAGIVPEPLAELGIKSLLVAPVRTITYTFGVMMVGREVAQDYTLHQRLLTSTVVNQMAIALEDMLLHEQIRESEEKYRSLINNVKLGVFRSTPEPGGKFLEVNPAMKEISGYSRKELLQLNVADLYVYPQERERVLEEIASGKGRAAKEVRLRKKDGTELVVLDRKVAVRDDAGKILYFDGIMEDITERKQAEEALRESEEKYRSLFDKMLDGFAYCKILVDENSRPIDYVHLEINDAWERLVGLKREDVIGKKITEVIPGIKESKTDLISIYGKVALTGEATEFELYFEPLGKWFTISVYSPEKGYFVATFDDITERKQAEKALQQSEERYRALINLGGKVGEAVIMVEDTEEVVGLHTFVSDEWSRITGYSTKELLGMSFFDLVHPKDRAACLGRHHRRRQGENVPGLYEITIVRKDGTEVPIEITAAVTTYKGKPANVGYIRDITERKQAEEREKQLQQELYLSSRLASIGELAAGVAHEINNPLTGMIGFSQRLLRKSTDAATSRDLKRIHHEAQRAAKIVQNLLTFARRHEAKKEYSDINDILGRALELRAYELRTSNIELAVELAPGLPKVMADFQQMQDVFLNIILNAEQAMTEAKGGGKLAIKTQKMKDHVKVCFTDDGPGIPTEHLVRLFDPFFTTRGERGGTGLGLSVCHGIVTEHGGRIYAKSKPGKGAIFSVELPLIDNDSDRVDGSGGFGITSLRNAFQP